MFNPRLCVLALVCFINAFAGPITGPVFSGNANNITINAPGTYISTNFSGGVNTTTITESYNLGESAVSGSGSVTSGSSGGGGEVDYFFEVIPVSGSYSGTVPLIFTASGMISSTPSLGPTAEALFEVPGIPGTLFRACNDGCTGGASSSSFNVNLSASANQLTQYQVTVSIRGGALRGHGQRP